MIRKLSTLSLATLTAFGTIVSAANAQTKEAPQIKIPDAGVPQALTMEGRYVRAAYNNEAYTILGYRLANLSVGEDWL